MSNFSKALNHYRTKHKLTLQDVADKSGCAKSFIWELENKRTVPSLDKAVAIASVFGLTISEFLNQRPIFSDDVMKIARQISDLETFHRRMAQAQEGE